MSGQAKIAWLLLTGLVLLAGWWTLAPKLGTATEAQVRAHVAPELLQPLPHPEGGVERDTALRQILVQLPYQPPVRGKMPEPRDLTNPLVSSAVDILRQGALDRSSGFPAPHLEHGRPGLLASQRGRSAQFVRFVNGLTKGAMQAADQRDWVRVVEHMEAACLLLDRLFESDAIVGDRQWTKSVETSIHRATLALAARGDLPAKAAARLAACLEADRHTATDMLRVLRGEMQLMVLPLIGAMPLAGRYDYQAGTYDPLETTELLSARFIATARDVGLPAARWSAGYQRVAPAFPAVPEFPGRFWRNAPYARYRELGPQLQWPVDRIRMNTARNSIGRFEAATYLDAGLMARVLSARTGRDQAAAALAVVRFRHRTGRDPQDFAELVAAGLLRTVPMNHALDQPLPFDLQALFQWPQVRAN
jgi:hypothetical protein